MGAFFLMNMKTYIYLALAVMVGILAGWLLRGPGEVMVADGDEGSSYRSSSQHGSASSTDSRKGRALRGGSRQANKAQDGGEKGERLHVDPESVAALLEAEVVDLERRKALVQGDEPLSRFLRLQEDEIRALNDLWKDISPRLHALRMENVRHQRLDDGGVWLGVESFAEEGDVLRQDFLRTTHGMLGDERGKVFLDAIKAHGAYGQWGKTVGTGYVVRVRVQDDGSHLYEITEQARADGTPGRKWQVAQIPAHLADMAREAGIALSP